MYRKSPAAIKGNGGSAYRSDPFFRICSFSSSVFIKSVFGAGFSLRKPFLAATVRTPNNIAPPMGIRQYQSKKIPTGTTAATHKQAKIQKETCKTFINPHFVQVYFRNYCSIIKRKTQHIGVKIEI